MKRSMTNQGRNRMTEVLKVNWSNAKESVLDKCSLFYSVKDALLNLFYSRVYLNSPVLNVFGFSSAPIALTPC